VCLCACCCRPPNPTLSSRTPAEQSAVEFNPALFLDPTVAHKMPAVNMGSSIVTAMPVMVNQVRWASLSQRFLLSFCPAVAVCCCAACVGLMRHAHHQSLVVEQSAAGCMCAGTNMPAGQICAAADCLAAVLLMLRRLTPAVAHKMPAVNMGSSIAAPTPL
jgi:hypothetical protein